MILPFVEYDLEYFLSDQRNIRITVPQIKWILYQIFSAIFFIHSGDIGFYFLIPFFFNNYFNIKQNFYLVHRDIKPTSILLDDNCNIKLASFGQARSLLSPNSFSAIPCSPYICPELLYKTENLSYAKAGDMWSIGCVFAELLRRAPLFTASDKPTLLKQIFSISECQPDPSYLAQNSALNTYQTQQPKHLNKIIFTGEVQGFESELDLLCKLLYFDPGI